MITADQIINLQPGDTIAQTNPRGEVIGPTRVILYVGALLPRSDKKPWRVVELKTDAGKPVTLAVIEGVGWHIEHTSRAVQAGATGNST